MSFSDQTVAPYYDVVQREKLRSVRVGIAGVGGLGSNCAMMLVRAGVENLILVDFDVVSFSNLNRQYFYPHQVGQAKVCALADNLRRINPDVKLILQHIRIEEDNLESIFADADIIVEAFDCPKAKALLARRYLRDDRPFVCVSGIAGYGNSDRIVTRSVGHRSWMVGDGSSDVESRHPFAPAVLIAAAKEADIVLENILNG